jgi:hypothetical protein
VNCPVCDQPGGVLYGRFHVPCFDGMNALDEDKVRADLRDEVGNLIESIQTAAEALTRVPLTGNNILDLGELIPLVATLRHDLGLRMLTLHQHRNALVARKVMMN